MTQEKELDTYKVIDLFYDFLDEIRHQMEFETCSLFENGTIKRQNSEKPEYLENVSIEDAHILLMAWREVVYKNLWLGVKGYMKNPE